MDEITPVKTKFRMEQWTQLIQDQRSSGMSVKAWCQQCQYRFKTSQNKR
ncbi:IS66 family insertion sequence element accessory protein TnpA [Acetobacterium wieringae]